MYIAFVETEVNVYKFYRVLIMLVHLSCALTLLYIYDIVYEQILSV